MVHTLRGLRVTAGESVFLDDHEVNIQAASKLGINALHFRLMAQLRTDLKSMGFTILPLDF